MIGGVMMAIAVCIQYLIFRAHWAVGVTILVLTSGSCYLTRQRIVELASSSRH